VEPALYDGAWNEEYEAIAERLAGVGAKHVQLQGFEHRPQDHADFNPLVEEFERKNTTG